MHAQSLHAWSLLSRPAALGNPVSAQPPDFYKGKSITLLMGTGPGGSYDIYGRTIAEHLGKHIPGRPNIVVEHMPGAGGVVAGNHIYGPAPQDGSRLLLLACAAADRAHVAEGRAVSRAASCTGSAPTMRSRR